MLTPGTISAIAPHTHIHVAADHGGSTCYFIAADDQNLLAAITTAQKKAATSSRAPTVKSVKLTRYGVSTLGGLAIGAGAGAAIGFAAIRPQPNEFLDFSGVARAVCAVVGGLGGTAVGASTDMFRGPVIYRRIETK